MDFIEAEQRFQMLDGQRQRGILTLEQYRTEVGRLRVKDQYGRLWMPQELTGQWYVHYNGEWMAAVAPHKAASAPTPVTREPRQQSTQQTASVSFDAASTQESVTQAHAPQTARSQGVSFDPLPGYESGGQPTYNAPLPKLNGSRQSKVLRQAPKVAYAAVASQRRVGKKRGPGCLGTILSIVIGVPLIWGIIGTVVYFMSDEDPAALYGVAAAMAISVLLSAISALQNWKGTITDIRAVRESSTDDDGYRSYRNVTYAWIRKPNGRTKKVRSHRDWRVGDQVEKRLGEFAIRHYPM